MLMAVSAALIVVTSLPYVREPFLDVKREQAAEDGVPGIRSCGGENAEVEILIDIKIICQHLLHNHPLVKPEAVDDKKENGGLVIQFRNHEPLHDVCRQRHAVFRLFQPVAVISFDKFSELDVALPLLVQQRLPQT